MQFKLQHADSQTDDPHDVIAAQLRDLAPRLNQDHSEVTITPKPAPEPASEPLLVDAPLNDNIGDIRAPVSRAGFGRGVKRLGLIVSAGCVMAVAWHSYGDAAKQKFSGLVPPLLVGASAPAQDAESAEQRDTASPAAESQQAAPASAPETVAAAPVAPSEPATAPSTQAAEAPPAQAELSLELAKSVETMAREIASLKETVEQLQAGQRQLSRDVAKATEQTAHRKPVAGAKPAPSPRPQPSPAAVSRTYAPPPPQTYPQGPAYPQRAAQRDAYTPPPAPAPTQQLPPPPGDTSVPRPPMPLR